MYKIEIHHEAEAEIKHASQYYEASARGLGEEFLTEIDEAFARIKRCPLA